jgi:truncated hemoglobin YjbI
MAQDISKMETTQTAVEWFYQRILAEDIKAVFEQAKAMEKEQIIKAACYEPFLGDFPRKEGEHYYNKNYESNT